MDQHPALRVSGAARGDHGGRDRRLRRLSAFEDWNLDFNSNPRPGTFRGAYAEEGANPGWLLALERKPAIEPIIFTDGFESGNTAAWAP